MEQNNFVNIADGFSVTTGTAETQRKVDAALPLLEGVYKDIDKTIGKRLKTSREILEGTVEKMVQPLRKAKREAEGKLLAARPEEKFIYENQMDIINNDITFIESRGKNHLRHLQMSESAYNLEPHKLVAMPLMWLQTITNMGKHMIPHKVPESGNMIKRYREVSFFELDGVKKYTPDVFVDEKFLDSVLGTAVEDYVAVVDMQDKAAFKGAFTEFTKFVEIVEEAGTKTIKPIAKPAFKEIDMYGKFLGFTFINEDGEESEFIEQITDLNGQYMEGSNHNKGYFKTNFTYEGKEGFISCEILPAQKGARFGTGGELKVGKIYFEVRKGGALFQGRSVTTGVERLTLERTINRGIVQRIVLDHENCMFYDDFGNVNYQSKMLSNMYDLTAHAKDHYIFKHFKDLNKNLKKFTAAGSNIVSNKAVDTATRGLQTPNLYKEFDLELVPGANSIIPGSGSYYRVEDRQTWKGELIGEYYQVIAQDFRRCTNSKSFVTVIPVDPSVTPVINQATAVLGGNDSYGGVGLDDPVFGMQFKEYNFRMIQTERADKLSVDGDVSLDLFPIYKEENLESHTFYQWYTYLDKDNAYRMVDEPGLPGLQLVDKFDIVSYQMIGGKLNLSKTRSH